MASTIQIPAEGRAARSAGERKSPKTSHDTSQSTSNAGAESTNPTESGDSEVQPIGQSSPEHHEIAQLAYSYWEMRGYQDGSDEEDWLRAENELRERRHSQITTQNEG